MARVLFREDEIRARVRALANAIADTYAGIEGPLTLVPVLSGSIIFVADLIRAMPLRLKLALIHVSTYPGRTTRAGEPKTVMALTGDVNGKHVLVVDDILDSGRTLASVCGLIREQKPASLRSAVLLRKPAGAQRVIDADFIGFDVSDFFVVGYGLDYDDLYRNYPHIGVLREELIR